MTTNNVVNAPFPLAIAQGGTAVTSVTTSPTASSWAGWDANKNMSADNFLSGYTTTATAAGTTTLTVNDTFQQFFTGSTTQTVVLPVTSTLTLGHQFYIVNNSTGIVTVQSSGANTVQAMAASTTLLVTCILTSGTTAASWSVEYVGAVSGGTVNAGTANQLAYYAGAGNTVSGLATANNGVLVTSAGGVPSISSTLPSGIAATNMNLTTPTLGVASATSINFGGSALSSYVESGSWTPGIQFGGGTTGITYALQTGRYTRIGNVVYIIGLFTLSNKGSSTGAAVVTGLPIAVGGSVANYAVISTNPQNVTLYSTNMLALPGSGGVSSTQMQLAFYTSAGSNGAYAASDFQNGTQIQFSGFYFVA